MREFEIPMKIIIIISNNNNPLKIRSENTVAIQTYVLTKKIANSVRIRGN